MSDEEPMWCLVMFDLPVKTKKQRREATQFRQLLLDEAFWMVQFSVYVRYTPTAASSLGAVRGIRKNLPAGGEVRIIHITDRQWARALRFFNALAQEGEPAPEQLTIF